MSRSREPGGDAEALEVGPGEVAEYIAGFADDLAVLARRHGLTRLANALDEAQRVALTQPENAAPEDAA